MGDSRCGLHTSLNGDWEEMGGRAVDHDPGYTALCSRLTLYSEKEGFFREFATGVMGEVAERTAASAALGVGQAFAALRTDQQRVQYVAALDGVTALEPPALYRSKAAKEARARREEGNAALKAGDQRKALLLYSASVMRAPEVGMDMSVDDGLTLAYALANRSAILMQLNRPDLAVRDASLALASGYPESKSHVLLERMGKCEEMRGQWTEALTAYEAALEALGKKPGEAGSKIQKAILRVKSCLESGGKKKPKAAKVATQLPSVTGGKSELLPNAAKSVGVAEAIRDDGNGESGATVGAGRFAVAVSDISAGDTLVAEPAFASVLLPEKAGTHCHYCFSRLYAPLPCKRCSGVAFCGSECRDAAESTYHQYECSVGSTLMASGLSLLSRLALRMLTQAPLQEQHDALEDHVYDPHTDKLWTKELPEGKSKGDRPTNSSGANKENDPGNKCGEKRYYDAKDYRAVMNLITLSDERSPVDMLERTLMAIFLIKCLRHSTFFKKIGSKEMEEEIGFRSEEEIIAARLLLHYLQMLQFNAHEIFETLYEKEYRFRSSKTQYIGVGIYPTVALFNHDCYPATTRYFLGTSIVVRALRPLKAGEAIPENYGPVFTKQSRRERQRILRSRYWFICRCVACLADWPTYEAMGDGSSATLRCTKVGCWNAIPVDGEALDEREQIICPKKDGDDKDIYEALDSETSNDQDGKGDTKKNRRKKKSRKSKANKCDSCSSSTINQMDKVVRLKATFEEALSTMDKAGETATKVEVDKAVKLFCKCIDGFTDSVFPPYRQHVLAQDSLRLCISSQGNIFVSETENVKPKA
ncbi:SET and MYND domain-containing protein 4-like isoform X2 [Ischnura elegans]|uniref:SET and MYND domain-containing protein 4-like isoform X2 n=2 Tax=Ischnura elegans TaxID=197161 RepID=UPI001ED87EA9|nr:SET and MYND domain-containing protein 4-like isoform X2 [Ischnura elegans]